VGDSDDTLLAPPRHRLWPPDPIIVVVVALAVGGIILLAGGEWAWGLVAILCAGIVFLSQREAERRAACYAIGAFLARFSATSEALAARSRGQLDVFRARRELAELQAERGRCFHQLGQAVFAEDNGGIKRAGEALDAIVERIAGKEAEIEALGRQMEERVQRAQAGVVPTVRMESPPEPVRIPEPWPPPDEGEIPTPDPVPEPSPDEPTPAPEHPPSPQTRARKRKR
jgi:hypothetical protein